MDRTELASTKSGDGGWAARYRGLDTSAPFASAAELDRLRAQFVAGADENTLNEYRAIMTGASNRRVHYPMVDTQDHAGPAVESYKWFVANEKDGARTSLPGPSPVGGAALNYLPNPKVWG